MIDDLDRTVAELIRRELPPLLVDQVGISFARPDETFPPLTVTLPAIDLFLYDLRENRDLRSNESLVEYEPSGSLSRQNPPVRVDCSYLITAWASSSSTTPAFDEHHLLGEVMRALLRHSTVPDAVLQGTLVGQDPPLATATLQTGPLQAVAEFWQALGGKPRAALNYTVTISVSPDLPVDLGPAVQRTILDFTAITAPGETA